MRRMPISAWLALTGALFFVPPAGAAQPVSGWRGNGTGLWPDARTPLEWSRIPRGALDGMRAQADRPKDEKPGDAPLVEKGLVRDWLVLGPFRVEDSLRDFDRESLAGEATVEPALAEKAGGLAWKRVAVPPEDITVFGTTELPWLDLGKAVGFELNQVA
jgi:hypothetical protein